MRILTLSNCPLVESQGSGFVITNFCQRLRERGHHVDLFGPESYDPLPGLAGKAKGYRLALGMLRLARLRLRSGRYDVVEFYGAESWLAASQLSVVPGRDFLMVSHSNGLETHSHEALLKYLGAASNDGAARRWYQFDHNALWEKAFTRVDRLVTVSQDDARYAQARGYQEAEHILAIENPLPDEFLGLSPSFERAPIMGYCGSWLARKGSHILTADLSRVLESQPECSLFLIGVGAGFEKEKHFPAHVCPRIQIFPFVESKTALRELYGQVAVAVAPSIYEGFGLVSAEAMACGCALVASRTGFAAGLKHREEAMLMDEPTSPLLHDAVQELLGDEPLRRRIAQAGHRRVQSLRWSHATDTLELHFERWAEEFRRAR